MIHTVIVPGVGGSEHEHWQSWLQRQLMSCSRVEQNDWNLPILQNWISAFLETVQSTSTPVQIVAHSFGCLTSIAALNQYPELTHRIKKMVLVAPANPERFGESGFARDSAKNYKDYFHSLKLNVPTEMLISENDPWLSFNDAKELAYAWKTQPINLGQVGHVNVASGFGPFPEIFNHIIDESTENSASHINRIDDGKLFFKFAI